MRIAIVIDDVNLVWFGYYLDRKFKEYTSTQDECVFAVYD